MHKISKDHPPLSFGVFYPTGHVLIAFAKDAPAKDARQDLLRGGYEKDEVIYQSADYVVSEIDKLRPHISLLAQLGSQAEQMERHYELSKQGCAWLIVYAPTDAEVNRVMNVARRYDIKLAQKYHRLVIEDLQI